MSTPTTSQLEPESWVCQRPPEGAQAYQWLASMGSTVRRLIRPAPPCVGTPSGPTYCHGCDADAVLDIETLDVCVLADLQASEAVHHDDALGAEVHPPRSDIHHAQRLNGFSPQERDSIRVSFWLRNASSACWMSITFPFMNWDQCFSGTCSTSFWPNPGAQQIQATHKVQTLGDRNDTKGLRGCANRGRIPSIYARNAAGFQPISKKSQSKGMVNWLVARTDQPTLGSIVWNTAWTSSSPSKRSINPSTSSDCSADSAFVVVGTRSKPDSTISCPSASSLD